MDCLFLPSVDPQFSTKNNYQFVSSETSIQLLDCAKLSEQFESWYRYQKKGSKKLQSQLFSIRISKEDNHQMDIQTFFSESCSNFGQFAQTNNSSQFQRDCFVKAQMDQHQILAVQKAADVNQVRLLFISKPRLLGGGVCCSSCNRSSEQLQVEKESDYQNNIDFQEQDITGDSKAQSNTQGQQNHRKIIAKSEFGIQNGDEQLSKLPVSNQVQNQSEPEAQQEEGGKINSDNEYKEEDENILKTQVDNNEVCTQQFQQLNGISSPSFIQQQQQQQLHTQHSQRSNQGQGHQRQISLPSEIMYTSSDKNKTPRQDNNQYKGSFVEPNVRRVEEPFIAKHHTNSTQLDTKLLNSYDSDLTQAELINLNFEQIEELGVVTVASVDNKCQTVYKVVQYPKHQYQHYQYQKLVYQLFSSTKGQSLKSVMAQAVEYDDVFHRIVLQLSSGQKSEQNNQPCTLREYIEFTINSQKRILNLSELAFFTSELISLSILLIKEQVVLSLWKPEEVLLLNGSDGKNSTVLQLQQYTEPAFIFINNPKIRDFLKENEQFGDEYKHLECQPNEEYQLMTHIRQIALLLINVLVFQEANIINNNAGSIANTDPKQQTQTQMKMQIQYQKSNTLTAKYTDNQPLIQYLETRISQKSDAAELMTLLQIWLSLAKVQAGNKELSISWLQQRAREIKDKINEKEKQLYFENLKQAKAWLMAQHSQKLNDLTHCLFMIDSCKQFKMPQTGLRLINHCLVALKNGEDDIMKSQQMSPQNKQIPVMMQGGSNNNIELVSKKERLYIQGVDFFIDIMHEWSFLQHQQYSGQNLKDELDQQLQQQLHLINKWLQPIYNNQDQDISTPKKQIMNQMLLNSAIQQINITNEVESKLKYAIKIMHKKQRNAKPPNCGSNKSISIIAITQQKEQIELLIKVMENLSSLFLNKNSLQDALEIQLLILQEKIRQFGNGDDARLVASYSLIGWLQICMEQYQQGEESITKAIQLRNRASQGRNQTLISSFKQLTSSLLKTICESNIEITEQDVVSDLSNLAIACFNQQKYKEAMQLYSKCAKALEAYNQSLNNNSSPQQSSWDIKKSDLYIYLAQVNNNMGLVLQEQNKLHESEACYIKSIDYLKQAAAVVAGDLNSGGGGCTTKVNNYTGNTEIKTNNAKTRNNNQPLSNFKLVEEEKIVDVQLQQLLSEADFNVLNNPLAAINLADPIGNLGNLQLKQGKLKEAERLFQQAISISKQIYGENHPKLAADIGNLGSVYLEQNRLEEAEKQFLQAIALKQPAEKRDIEEGDKQQNQQQQNQDFNYEYKQQQLVSQNQHPSICMYLSSLGNVYKQQGKIQEAENMFQKSIQLKTNFYGQDHYSLASDLINLGNLKKKQGDIYYAEQLYDRAIKILKSKYGDDCIQLADPYSNLANIYSIKQLAATATQLYEQAIKLKIANFGPDHYSLAPIYLNFGNLLERHENRTKALHYFSLAEKIIKATYGENHYMFTILQNSKEKINKQKVAAENYKNNKNKNKIKNKNTIIGVNKNKNDNSTSNKNNSNSNKINNDKNNNENSINNNDLNSLKNSNNNVEFNNSNNNKKQ